MSKKLIKISITAATLGTLVVGGAFPAFASLCPNTVGGVTIPGCNSFNINTAITSVISLMLFISFVIALIFLIFGGIRWIMSGGDKEATGKAKETVTSALVGLAVVLGAFILINIVINLITGGSFGNATNGNQTYQLNVGG